MLIAILVEVKVLPSRGLALVIITRCEIESGPFASLKARRSRRRLIRRNSSITGVRSAVQSTVPARAKRAVSSTTIRLVLAGACTGGAGISAGLGAAAGGATGENRENAGCCKLVTSCCGRGVKLPGA